MLELSASSKSSLLTTNPGLIDLHLAAQRIPRCIHHCSAKFVQHHPCGLVADQAQLTLQKQGGHASLVRSHQVRGPEPVRQRNFCAMKDSPRCHRDLEATFAALLAPLVQQLIGFSMPAAGANESIRPTTSGQILLACFLRREVGLKLPQRLRERRSWHASNTTYWGLLSQPDKQKLARRWFFEPSTVPAEYARATAHSKHQG